MFQKKRSVCIHTRLTGCSYMAIGSVAILKLCNAALALGSAFKNSFDCQVSQHMGDARPAHSAHREGYVGGAKHHCYMDFLKARGVFSCPNKPAVGQYPNIIAQSCSCIGRSRPQAPCALLWSVLFSPCERLVAFWLPLDRHLDVSCSGAVYPRDYSPKYASLQSKKPDEARFY